MKVFIICSKRNYGLVPSIVDMLEERGHQALTPNCMGNPDSEKLARDAGTHSEFKQRMYAQSAEMIRGVDAVLVVNPGGYIGGATFLEMYDAFREGKAIYMLERVRQQDLCDEVDGFAPCYDVKELGL